MIRSLGVRGGKKKKTEKTGREKERQSSKWRAGSRKILKEVGGGANAIELKSWFKVYKVIEIILKFIIIIENMNLKFKIY
jgi:hypothetical protein